MQVDLYRHKYKLDGTLDWCKARLVANGYTSTYGIDYKMFASMANMNTVCIHLSLAAHYGWELHQVDAKNAFLHGSLVEEIYMENPLRFGPTRM